MDLKLNDSEISGILTLINESLGHDLEPLERTTLLNIVKKITGQIAYRHHEAIDEFAVDILNWDYEKALKNG